MERSAAHSLVATFLRQRSEELKSCEMVIELKNKRLKGRVIAVGVASNQHELSAAAAAGDGGGSGGGLEVGTTGELDANSIAGSFSARFYIFKEDATGKRLVLHSSYELRRLEGLKNIDANTEIGNNNANNSNNINNTVTTNNSYRSNDPYNNTNNNNNNADVLDALLDTDSIGLIMDFKNSSPMTFSFESEAQREAIAASIKRLIRTYGSIEQRQTILGIGLKLGAGKRSAALAASKNKNGQHNLGDDVFGVDGEKAIRAKLEELRQDKQHGFGAVDQRLLMDEMSKVAAYLVRGSGGGGGRNGGGGGVSAAGLSVRQRRNGVGGASSAAQGRSSRHRSDGSAAVVRLFDNPHIFSEHLIDKMQRTELKVIRNMLSNDSIRSWENISMQAKMLGGEVENIQERIESYASHIAGRKSSIEEIEHNIINAHRRERNFQALHSKMEFLQHTLELTPEINSTVEALQSDSAMRDPVSFFSNNPKNARVLCDAMRLTDQIIRNGLVRGGGGGVLAPPAELPVGAPSSAVAPSDSAIPVEDEYPVVAVVERKRYFAQMRRTICRGGKLYANSILEALFRQLWTSQLRFSKNYRLVLQPHSDLVTRLSSISAIICGMQSVDPEGFMYLLRMYRQHNQRIYQRELTSFFDAMRGSVKRLGWQLRSKNSGKKDGDSNIKGKEEKLRGPSLLGNSNHKLRREDVFNHWAETNEAGFGDNNGYNGVDDFGMSISTMVSPQLLGGITPSVRGGGGAATPQRPPLYGMMSPSPAMPSAYKGGGGGAVSIGGVGGPSYMYGGGGGGSGDSVVVYSNADGTAVVGSGATAAGGASIATPRGRSGSVMGASSNGASKKQFTVQLPELHKAHVRLHRPSAAQKGVAAAAKSFQTLSAFGKSFEKIKGSDGGGFLRPDIAFGMALEGTIDLILTEEEALGTIFGLYAPFMGGPGPKSSNSVPSPPEPPSDRLTMPPHEISFNLQSTLRELFGGSTLTGPSKGLRRRPLLSKNSSAGGAGNINEDEDASPATLANRKKNETSASNPSLEWRHMTARERRDVAFPTPKGTEIDSDYVSSEGDGSDSDDSDNDNEKKSYSSTPSAKLKGSGAANLPEYSSSKSRKEFLLERNIAKEQLYRLTRKLVKTCDRVYVPAMLCMVEAMLGITHNNTTITAVMTGGSNGDGHGGDGANLPFPHTQLSRAQTSYFCVNILCKLHKKLSSAFDRHLREQSRSIVHCAHKFILQPEALLPCFPHLSLLLARLDATHDALDRRTCVHYRYYDTLVLTLVDHCFDVLDQLSHVKAIGSSSSTGVSLLTLPHLSGFFNTVRAKIGAMEEERSNTANIALGTSKEVKRGFFMQLRHNAMFCYVYNALSPTSHARVLLAGRYERCTLMRDRYEELYLTRSIFTEEMPNFSRFINMCTELVSAYTLSDLVHSKTLSRERMEEVLSKLDKEIVNGLKSSASRIKRHFSRDVGIDSPDEVFHRQLLKAVWGHYVAMVKNKINFLNELLQWEAFSGLVSPLTPEAVEEALKEAV